MYTGHIARDPRLTGIELHGEVDVHGEAQPLTTVGREEEYWAERRTDISA